MESRLYLYLARRDKKGMKVLATFKGPLYPATRVTDIESLNMPKDLERKVARMIHEERMLWEPWIEGVESYNDLRDSLRGRGYSNIPSFHTPVLLETSTKIGDEPNLEEGVKTMIRRGSRQSTAASNQSSVNKKASRVNLDQKLFPFNFGNRSPVFRKFKS